MHGSPLLERTPNHNLPCGTAIRKNVSTSLQVLDEVEMTLVDWQRGNLHCELIQHPENP